MPDITQDFDSQWLKANLNTKQGDHIRFMDTGTREQDAKDPTKYKWVFLVGVVRNGKVVAQKKFQLNSANFKATSVMYGTNSDNWLGKEMMVNVVKKQNPQNGQIVDSIGLSKPGLPGEVDALDEALGEPSVDFTS